MLKQRLFSLLLALIMTLSLLPASLTHAEEDPATPTDDVSAVAESVGEAETVAPNEDWDEAYPFGTFAFANHQADIAEPGATTAEGEAIPQTLLIPVQRLGGTVGRATVHIMFAPAVTMDENGEEYVFDYAASGKLDVLIETEDPNPFAAYQPIGVPDAERNMTASDVYVVLPEAGESVAAEDALTLTLSEPVDADSYRWQAAENGVWQDITDAVAAELPMIWGDLWDFESDAWTGLDFRCIYRKDGALFCTESLLGEAYVSPYTDPEPAPDGLELPEEPTYSVQQPDGTFGICEFDLVFAEGETVKYIRVTALDDETAELPEFGLFTIVSCEGGTLSDVCNTLTLMISDNDAGEASTLGFAAETVEIDRAAGMAKVKVVRTGGSTYEVTVHYTTEDGTALAGVDYAETEGDLAFVGSFDEMEITVPLIANGDTEEKQFSIVLSDVRGGGVDHLCTLSNDRIAVTLTGSASLPGEDEAGQNMATLLTGMDGRDVSGNVHQGDEPLIQIENGPSLHADTVMGEGNAAAAQLLTSTDTRSYRIRKYFYFTRGDLVAAEEADPDNIGYWRDWDDMMGCIPHSTEGTFDETASYNNPMTWTVSPDSGTSGIDFTAKEKGREYNDSGEVRGFGGGYFTMTVDTNYRGHAVASWTGDHTAGDYYDQLLVSLGWVRPGVRKTWFMVSRHRYLRPQVTMTIGNWSESKSFNVDTSASGSDLMPKSWEAYCRLRGRGDWQWDTDSVYHYNHTYDNYDGPFLGFEEDIGLRLDFQFYETWTHTKATDYDSALTESDMYSKFDIRTFSGHRRVFRSTGTQGIDLIIHTANDSDEPNDFTKFSDNSVYDNFKPTITIQNKNGGVSQSNDLYVGSVLIIDTSNMPGNYVIPDGGVYMANSKGDKVGVMTPDSNDGNIWYCTMIWDGIGENDLNEMYSLHVFYNRVQTVKIDISPSVPRLEDGITIDTEQIEPTWEAFLGKTITGQASALNNDHGNLSFATTDFTWNTDNLDGFKGDNGVFSTVALVTNHQTICFHQNPDDVILYNQHGYAGNAEIPISAEDLTGGELFFEYYGADYLDALSHMEVFIDHVELYYDKNGDGVISGSINENGNFVLDVDSDNQPIDTYVSWVSGDYPDSFFKPLIEDEKDGVRTIHQYYFKVYYRTRPRALKVPKQYTGNEKAQLLPAFTSAVTDPLQMAKLTEEQCEYRYVIATDVDDQPMFGEDANARRTIDIPLGGDVGTLEMTGETNLVYDDDGNVTDTESDNKFTWDPNFVGNLLVSFDTPSPIVDTNNATGGDVALAGENPTINEDGTWAFSEQGLGKLNGYLGAFVGRTTFAIGIQEQKKPSRSAQNGDSIDSFDDIKPETVAMGTVSTTPNADNLTGMDGGNNIGATKGTGPDLSDDTEPLKTDLGVKLPSLQFGIGDYATVIMDGYQVGFAISIPLYKKESSKTWKYDEDQDVISNLPDGTVKREYRDDLGYQHTEYTYTDANGSQVKADVSSKEDPNDPNRRVKTVKTWTTSNGRTTYREVAKTQEKRGNNWVGVSKKTTDQEPEVPSTNGYMEANSGMVTLAQFVSACASRDSGTLSKFMNGLFQDDNLTAARNGNTMSKGFGVSFTVQIAVMFEYNPIDDCMHFKSAGISGMLGFQWTWRIRFTGCPVLYFYAKIGIELKLSTGLTEYRIAVYGDEITTFTDGSLKDLETGGEAVFALDMRNSNTNPYRGFGLSLRGRILLEVYDNAELTGTPLISGALSGNGAMQDVVLKKYDKIVYVRLKAKTGDKTTSIDKIQPIKDSKSKITWDGFTFEPSVTVEAGIGAGIEVAKLEVYIKVSVSIAISMGKYLPETDTNEGFYLSDFKGTIALGINAVFLFFNFSMDAVSFGYEGKQHGTRGYFDWHISASAVNGSEEFWSTDAYTDADGNTLPGEPQAPTGENISPDNPDIKFFLKDDSAFDTSDSAPSDQGWTIMKGISPVSWKGGDFQGDPPLNNDLSQADEDGVYVKFTPKSEKIKIYFYGKIKVVTAANSDGEEFTKSPATADVGTEEVKIVLTEGTRIDRYQTAGASTSSAGSQTRTPTHSLVHVTRVADPIDTQRVISPGNGTRAITPTGTDVFQLSGYNTSGDARVLTDGILTGYDFLLVPAGEENYLVYQLSVDGAPQLVLSRIVMTNDLSTGSGLVHPLTGGSDPGYLVLDGDGFTDFGFDAVSMAEGLLVSWVTYTDETENAYAVKQRTVPLSDGAELPDPVVLATGSDPCLLPASENGRTLWVGASGDGANDNALLKQWLLARYPDLTEEMLDSCKTYNAQLASAVFYWATQSYLNRMGGDNSVLHVKKGDTELTAEIGAGERIQNLESTTLGDRILLMYTTTKVAYLDTTPDVPVTVGVSDIDQDTEKANIHSLYLRTVDDSGFSDPICIRTAVDYENCTDDTIDAAKLKDGLYSNGSQEEQVLDPLISNLQFVTVKLDGDAEEAMALFEMGDNTWMLPISDIDALLAGGAAELTPVFSQFTGIGVTACSDSENAAIVYTAAVPSSMSNAIYVSWWDKHAGSWGSPTILAMRNLQIYEDSITYEMSPDDTEKAYFGQMHTEGGHTGTKDYLKFSNLQMSIAKVGSDGTEHDQMVILTNGALTKLKDGKAFINGKQVNTLIPDGAASVGFYAIAFGAGTQAVGEGNLGFANQDFTAGSKLHGEVSFRNTGTAAIRASEANPMTVRLMVTAGAENLPAQELARWELTKSIPSGAQTLLTFESSPLQRNLRAGNQFYLDIAEDSTYFEDGFFTSLGPLFELEEAPELSFNNFDLTLRQVKSGIATFAFSATVVNNGSADAHDVFIQFSHDTGETDDFGNRVRNPIDITGSKLETSTQKPIRGAGDQNDFENGIYHLIGEDGSDLNSGYSRTVSGELRVPVSCFVSADDISGLHLSAEIYSAVDSPSFLYGVYGSEHAEYNKANNLRTQTVKHHTEFTVPSRITTALGTTLVLPVTFEATDDYPELQLREISDGTPDWTPRMGVCYYDEQRRVIVAAPNSTAQALIEAGETPTGILQLHDVATNTIETITYEITPMGQGVNIYRDDASFTFYNADGSLTDLYAEAADHPGWSFLDKGVSVGWTGGEPNEIPMNHDLSLANQDGAYFTMETVADTMTFYFMGEITVKSSIFGTQRFTSSPATMTFNNPTGAEHLLTVTAKAGTKIDRYVATYKEDPIVDPDTDAPQILWSRSFPDVASMQNGESLTLTCYIVDGMGIRSVTFDDTVLTETTTPAIVKVTDTLWYFDYTFTENDTFHVHSTDYSGNMSSETVRVEWFNSVISADANADAPGLLREHIAIVDENGDPIDTSKPFNTDPWISSSYEPRSDEQSNAYVFSGGAFAEEELEKDTGERWKAIANGSYQVYVERDDETWARAVFAIENLDSIVPELSVNVGENQLEITASDDTPLASLTVNGYELPTNGKVFTGVFPVRFNGNYTVKVTDQAGNMTFTTVNVEIPIAINKAETNITCANGDVKAHLTVTLEDVIGGDYDPSISDPSQNLYAAAYEIATAPEGTTDAPETGWTALNDSCTLDLEEGVYELFLRNGVGQTAKHPEAFHLYHPESWGTPTYEWTKTETGYTVTATSVCELDATHITTETVDVTGVVTTEPVCEKDGVLTFTAEFTNALFTKQVKHESIPMIGHAWGEPTYTWSVTEEGHTVEALSICAHDETHHLTETVVAAETVITPATCLEPGEMRYTATFENSLFTEQTTTGPIPPTGHDWEEPTYEWSDDLFTVTAKRICRNDSSHVETETVETMYAIVTEPQPYVNGLGRYTTKAFENPAFTEQTKDVEIPMLVVTYVGSITNSLDTRVVENGEALYRFDVRLIHLPNGEMSIDSMQIFLTYDHKALAFRRAEGAVDWMVNDKKSVLSAVWASDEDVTVKDGDVVLTLYFAAIDIIESGTFVAIDFTENAMGSGSALSYADETGVKELEADTQGGGFLFVTPLYGDANCDGAVTAADAALILRAVVGLSALSPRGAVNADVDNDLTATAADAAAILRYVIGLIHLLPVE